MAHGEFVFGTPVYDLHEQLMRGVFRTGWNGGDSITIPTGEVKACWLLPRFIRVVRSDDLAAELALYDEDGRLADGYALNDNPDSTEVRYDGTFTAHYGATLQIMPFAVRPRQGALEAALSDTLPDPMAIRVFRAAAERTISLTLQEHSTGQPTDLL